MSQSDCKDNQWFQNGCNKYYYNNVFFQECDFIILILTVPAIMPEFGKWTFKMCYRACSNEQFIRQHLRKSKTIFFRKWLSKGCLDTHLAKSLLLVALYVTNQTTYCHLIAFSMPCGVKWNEIYKSSVLLQVVVIGFSPFTFQRQKSQLFYN